jgi:hypothetical protein
MISAAATSATCPRIIAIEKQSAKRLRMSCEGSRVSRSQLRERVQQFVRIRTNETVRVDHERDRHRNNQPPNGRMPFFSARACTAAPSDIEDAKEAARNALLAVGEEFLDRALEPSTVAPSITCFGHSSGRR